MQMMSNGGIGGGVSSAVARARGAGRMEDANALVLHALVIAVAFGLLFTAAQFIGGRALYAALGGRGNVLAASLAYANVVFAGSVLVWIVNLLASALRGSGNVVVPAVVTFTGAVVVVALSPALIFGWGPMPRLGIAGAGIAVVTYYLSAAVALIGYLRSGRGALRLSFDVSRFEWRLFADVLRVGLLSAIGTVQANLTVVLITGAVGLFGTSAIAGYGIASRLDYLLIPLLFGVGTSALIMVGTNMGAGQIARARRAAWIGGLVAAAFTEAVGLLAALFPYTWLRLFSDEPAVLATGALYLRIVGPTYGLVGLGMLLYFAGQGAGRVVWPVLAGAARLVVAAILGWIVVRSFDANLTALFSVVAVASIMFGGIIAATMWLRGWER